ncbi:MAG: division plane positioning ATPase MipZ [Hyphomicrobiales bacterium]|nr:division plane positioning ATPase MipZ [Hyphomicrobiales bacterium]
MKVITLATQKGGSGKSTVLVSCAVAALECGERVYILEMDRQGTVSQWAKAREAETPDVDCIDGPRLEAALSALKREGYSLVLIDTPGVDTPGTRPAMKAADLCVLPVRPTGADVQGCLPTARALVQMGVPFVFLLNQTQPQLLNSRAVETSSLLAHVGEVLEVSLASRTDYQDALASGLGVTEFDSKGKAAKEVRALWRELARRLQVGGHHVEAA